MKKITYLIALLILNFNSLHAQVTTVLTGFVIDIVIDGNNLYYTDFYYFESNPYGQIKKLNIGPGFPVTTLMYSETVDQLLIGSMVLNGNDLYYLTFFNYSTDLAESIKKINLTDFTAPSTFSEDVGVWYSELAYRANTLYKSDGGEIYKYNIFSSPPVTHTSLAIPEYIENGMLIDGSNIYIGDQFGVIHSRSLLFASTFTPIFTSPTGHKIQSIAKFEGYIYYGDSDGIHRFDAAAVAPIAETIASSSYFEGLAFNIVPKILHTGQRVLYVADLGHKLIKIDLDDPSLVINQNTISKSNVYPNPTKDLIHIQSNAQINAIELYDLIGKKVLEEKPIEKLTEKSLDISKLEPNIYLLKIKTADGEESKKIIKE